MSETQLSFQRIATTGRRGVEWEEGGSLAAKVESAFLLGDNMLDEGTLEHRLSALEGALSELQLRFVEATTSSNWLHQITGSISDEAAFLEALEYGRSLRQADRPANGTDE